jgi:membrane-associated protein
MFKQIWSLFDFKNIFFGLEHITYFGIFLVTALIGYFIPLPEEVILITVGYVAGQKIITLAGAMTAALAGAAGSDIVMYYLSRTQNKRIDTFVRRLDPIRLNKYQGFIRRRAGFSIFFFRLVVGLRFFGPILAGMTGVRPYVFIFYNTLALALYIPLLIYIGYEFHLRLDAWIAEIVVIRHSIFVGTMILIGFILTVIARRCYVKKNCFPRPRLKEQEKV